VETMQPVFVPVMREVSEYRRYLERRSEADQGRLQTAGKTTKARQ
jgi:hypothetical protein